MDGVKRLAALCVLLSMTGFAQAESLQFGSDGGGNVVYSVGPETAYRIPPSTPMHPLGGVAYLGLEDASGNWLGWGSGSLLKGGQHILTAAHTLTDLAGNQTVAKVTVYFEDPTSPPFGLRIHETTTLDIHAGWDGNVFHANDLAILTLGETVHSNIPRYDIYRNSDEIGQQVTIVGRGNTGIGANTSNSAWPHKGDNVYEDTHDNLANILYPGHTPDSVLIYDFDDGTAAHDFFDFFYTPIGFPLTPGRVTWADLGLGDLESASASGDSGGAGFIDGKLAGVISFKNRIFWLPDPANSPDVDTLLNSSWGEYMGDTRVSFYQDWILARVAGLTAPEPGSLALLAVGALLLLRRRPKRN